MDPAASAASLPPSLSVRGVVAPITHAWDMQHLRGTYSSHYLLCTCWRDGIHIKLTVGCARRWDDSKDLATHARQYMGAQWHAACINAAKMESASAAV